MADGIKGQSYKYQTQRSACNEVIFFFLFFVRTILKWKSQSNTLVSEFLSLNCLNLIASSVKDSLLQKSARDQQHCLSLGIVITHTYQSTIIFLAIPKILTLNNYLPEQEPEYLRPLNLTT